MLEPSGNRPGTARVLVLAVVLVTAGFPLLGLSGAAGPTDGEDVPGPTEATIQRDAHGIPHITASDAYSLWYGAGYAQARDRLFQMDVFRHIGYGDSALLFGEMQLGSDMQVRRDLYTREQLRDQFEQAPDQIQLRYRAYADGVNRYIQEATAKDELPVEFPAVAHTPEPWSPIDSVAINAFIVGFFGVGGGSEIDNAQVLGHLQERIGSDEGAWEAFGDWNWLDVEDAPTTIPASEKRVEQGLDAPALEDVPDEQLELAEAAEGAQAFGIPADVEVPESLATGQRDPHGLLSGSHWGSNALVVNGTLTETGEPMMLGGPQTGYFKPPLFHQMSLHTPEVDVDGVGIMGVPGISIGRTVDFAWTITSGADDQVDTVALELDPDDKHRFRWDGSWEQMECRTETHKVVPNPALLSTGSTDTRVVVQEVCKARGMPVVAWTPEDDVAWAQRVTTRGEELTSASARPADDMDGFLDQLATHPFTFNFLFAGEEGIAYIHAGDLPIRDPDLDPRLPALPGSDHGWRGELVGEALGAKVVNPDQGYLASWNNAPAEGWTAGDSAIHWGSIHRVQLLEHFLAREINQTGGELTVSSIEEVNRQAATHDPYARHTIPHLIDAARDPQDPQMDVIASALADWRADDYAWADTDGDDRYDHEAHAIWDETRRRLQTLVLEDELGPETPSIHFERTSVTKPHAADHGGPTAKDVVLVDALENRTDHDWCDDVATDDTETCDEILLEALDQASQALADRFGDTAVDAWHEPEHQVTFFPIGAQTSDTIDVVNRGSWNQIVAIGEGLEGSKSILPPSNIGRLSGAEFMAMQAGEPEPDRLTNQLDRFVAFEYVPFPATPEQVDEVAETSRTLTVPPPKTSTAPATEPIAGLTSRPASTAQTAAEPAPDLR